MRMVHSYLGMICASIVLAPIHGPTRLRALTCPARSDDLACWATTRTLIDINYRKALKAPYKYRCRSRSSNHRSLVHCSPIARESEVCAGSYNYDDVHYEPCRQVARRCSMHGGVSSSVYALSRSSPAPATAELHGTSVNVALIYLRNDVIDMDDNSSFVSRFKPAY